MKRLPFMIPEECDYDKILERIDPKANAQVKCGACSSCKGSCGGTSKCK